MQNDQDFIDQLVNSPARTATPPASYAGQTAFEETCPKCGGSGVWRRGLGCFKCNGRGKITRKTDPFKRADSRQRRAAKKASQTERNWTDFMAAQPEVAAWIDANPTFEFAIAMKVAVGKYGDLTEKQLAACLRCVAKRAETVRADAHRIADAREVNMDALTAAFSRAGASLKRPALRFDGLKVYPARNKPGVLYVVGTEANGEGERAYLGKVADGKFTRSRECTAEQQAAFLAAAADPLAASIRYGRLTGSCGACGRPLTDPESVSRGIGPVCAEKFFGG